MELLNGFGVRRSEIGRRSPVNAGDARSLSDYVEVLSEQRSSAWAWGHYKDVLVDLLRIRDAKRVMEIGGGRFPLFQPAEIAPFDVEYIINDVSASELARAPSEMGKVRFDIASPNATDIDALADTVDLTFSKMVFEHVVDALQAYKNVYKILSHGGICLNFHPVLYSLPFLINYLAPTTSAERLLQKFSPKRNHNQEPKFPATYDCCRVSECLRNTLQSIGYRQVWQLPFWFHEYFVKFPGLRECDWMINKIAERGNWTALASYCYTIVVK